MSYQIERMVDARIPKMSLLSKSYVIAHESGNPNNVGAGSMMREVRYMLDNWRNAFVTHWVGDGGRIVQIAEDGYISWGAGQYMNPHAVAQVELARTNNAAQFKKDYAAYIWLLRHLADKYGLPKKLDSGRTGVWSHNEVSNMMGGTDHTDPFAYLASFGVSRSQFAHDIANGISGASEPVIEQKPQPKPQQPGGIEKSYKENGLFIAGKTLYVFREPRETDANIIRENGRIVKYERLEVLRYHTVHIGNGYVWLEYLRAGGGSGFVACRTYQSGRYGEPFGYVKQDKPLMVLSPMVSSWRVYPLNVAPVAGKERGSLNPAKYGGLVYEVEGYRDNGQCAVIQTGDFGTVKIFIDNDATFY